MKELFYFLVFPGFCFALVAGCLLSWFDRKVTAWIQFRKGPPLVQPFYDVLKLLLVKETILPAGGSMVMFLLAPVIALFGAIMACVLILLPVLNEGSGFQGDVIVIFYLLNIPSLFYVLGAMASGNPLAAVGASREIKLMLVYELSFILVLTAIVLKSGMAVNLPDIMTAQADNAFIGSLSGVLLFIVSIFWAQAKLGMVPFDLAEAETEINHGAFIEYSGTIHALILMTKNIMIFTVPAFISMLLLGGLGIAGSELWYSLLKIAGIVLLFTLIRNTNPRLKIRQSMLFFFVWMNLLAISAIVFVFLGH